jgi:ribosomal protein S5
VPEPVGVGRHHEADVTGAIAKARRRGNYQLLAAAIMGGLSVGVAVMSLIGQSFSLRQARALEAIQHAVEGRCAASPTNP